MPLLRDPYRKLAARLGAPHNVHGRGWSARHPEGPPGVRFGASGDDYCENRLRRYGLMSLCVFGVPQRLDGRSCAQSGPFLCAPEGDWRAPSLNWRVAHMHRLVVAGQVAHPQQFFRPAYFAIAIATETGI